MTGTAQFEIDDDKNGPNQKKIRRNRVINFEQRELLLRLLIK